MKSHKTRFRTHYRFDLPCRFESCSTCHVLLASFPYTRRTGGGGGLTIDEDLFCFIGLFFPCVPFLLSFQSNRVGGSNDNKKMQGNN